MEVRGERIADVARCLSTPLKVRMWKLLTETDGTVGFIARELGVSHSYISDLLERFMMVGLVKKKNGRFYASPVRSVTLKP